MRFFNSFIFLLLTVFFVGKSSSFGQKRKELESKKNQINNEITFTSKLLNDNKKETLESQNKLVLVSKKINLREEYIQNLNTEIKILDNKIEETNKIVESLNLDIVKLKEEYARVIYYTYLNRNKHSRLAFILSSGTFNQAFKRIKYFEQYSGFRKRQAQIIRKTEADLTAKIIELQFVRADKEKLTFTHKQELNELTSEKVEKQIILKALKKNEKQLKRQLSEQVLAAEKVQREILKLIEEETRKAAEKLKASKTTGSKDKSIYQLTPEEKLISKNFSENKNRLPWPTEQGVIIDYFGEHAHPVLKGVTVRNDGIDIATTEGALVRAVFEGEVSRIFAIPGANKTIILRHGNFLTVYSNLKDILVKPGDKVIAKQNIGTVFTDRSDGNKSNVKFQLWKENSKLDPEQWLAKTK